jgi:heterodisulfide reductase subunit A
MARVGVFVCHCGENIARTVQVQKVVDFAKNIPGAVITEDYPYMCSAPGQKKVIEAIKEHDLDRVVVAACSPQLHEPTFRVASVQAGLNPFLCEMANIREHCSWVHGDSDSASHKACQLVAAAVERVKHAEPLDPIEVPVTKKALVIGGGVAGIRTALDMANAGYPVVLVEKGPSIGGNMSRLSETFPTLDCSQCILTPLMVQVTRHPNIELLTYSEVEEVSGFVGNFTAKIRRKPRYVTEDCTACGDCTDVCPEPGPNEFDLGLATRKAIYIPFPQAVPSIYTLDADRCLNAKLESETGFRVLACVRCQEACQAKVIDFDMRPEIVEREVGAIVVATGFKLKDPTQARRFGYGRYPDVMDGLEFERLLSASGPTDGVVRRPSDGEVPQDVVFIQCVGSRNPKHGVSYCSRICCMYTAKHAMLYRHKVPEGRATVFYMDIRAAGKGYEEFVQRAMEEERVNYVRGRVGQVIEKDDGKLQVLAVDTLSGRPMEIDADMVVVANAMEPADQGEIAGTLRIAADSHGFFQEAHPKLRPVETLSAGIYLAGAAQAPKDIPDTVSQASAAASKGLELLSKPMLERDPTTAQINEVTCAGCFECQLVCPYQAIEAKEITDRDGNVIRVVAWSNPAMCEGCGVCTVTCRSGNIDLFGYSEEQIFAQLGALAPLPEELGR